MLSSEKFQHFFHCYIYHYAHGLLPFASQIACMSMNMINTFCIIPVIHVSIVVIFLELEVTHLLLNSMYTHCTLTHACTHTQVE